jgi:cysteine desulfurase
VFTSGGTESDNHAVLGVAAARADRGRHVVITAVEHAAVDRACMRLAERGFRITRVPVGTDGRVDADEVAAAIGAETVLVSVIHAQNETGVLQPVRAIAERARERGVVVHTDAAQSAGKLPIGIEALGADLLTIAGHKLYAPKGVGALIVRRDTPLAPLVVGAGHEGGRRAGTENVPGIVALGAACALAERELPGRTEHLRALRDRLVERLRTHVADLVVHGEAVERLPNTTSVAFPGTTAIDVVERTEGVALAAGAACHSGRAHVSSVLSAMGVPEALALATLRLCVGRPTTESEVDAAADRIGAAVRAVRV